jgi:hypothetical protein
MVNGSPSHAELWVGRDGTFELNAEHLGGGGRRPVSRGELTEWLALLGEAGSTHYLVVESAPDAPCSVVRPLAQELRQLPLCKERRCLDRSAWENYKGD